MAEIRVKETGTIKLFESDNTSSVTIASPASLGADRTITLPDGDVTLVAGTMSTGGVTLSGSTNNTVTTVTGADALQGETNLIYDGTILGCGATGASADLGVGLHIRTADTSASVSASADELVIETGTDGGMSILSPTDGTARIYFGDSGDNDIGQIRYDHNNNAFLFLTNASERMRILGTGELCIARTTASQSAKISVENTADTPTLNVEGVHATQSTKVFKVYSARNTSGGSYNLAEFENGAATKCLIQDGGNVENTNNSYGAISDERIKKDITDANSQWEDIKSVKVKNFKLKEDDSYTHLGVIAQELETANMNGLVHEQKPTVENIVADSSFGEIEDDIDRPIKWLNGEALPEGISVNDNKLDSDGNIQYHKKVKTIDAKVKSVKYSILYMKAIKALQESMERIETLEAKVTALENK